MFRILVFYYSENALDKYLDQFYFMRDPFIEKRIRHNQRDYVGSFFTISCRKGIAESARGYKVDFIAVQEEITWDVHWPELRDCILKPMMQSPIPIHIFDGISYEDAATDEEGENKPHKLWV